MTTDKFKDISPGDEVFLLTKVGKKRGEMYGTYFARHVVTSVRNNVFFANKRKFRIKDGLAIGEGRRDYAYKWGDNHDHMDIHFEKVTDQTRQYKNMLKFFDLCNRAKTLMRRSEINPDTWDQKDVERLVELLEKNTPEPVS